MKIKVNKKEIDLLEFQEKCKHSNYKRFITTWGDESCKGCGKLLKSKRNSI